MSWKNKISGCFGQRDLFFANHSNDVKRALDLIYEAFNLGVSKKEVYDEFYDFLLSKNVDEDHLQNEMVRVETFLTVADYFYKRVRNDI